MGSIKFGLLEGYGEYTCSTGDVYKGHFVGGKKHGAGKMFYRDGGTFEGVWFNDTRKVRLAGWRVRSKRRNSTGGWGRGLLTAA